MDRIVIDSSVLIKWFVVEDDTTEALQIRARYDADELTLLAPDLINAEIGNIVWKKKQKGLLLPDEAQGIVNDFLNMELELTPTVDLLEAAYGIATTYGCTVYDAMYVALSEQEGCSLVTADEKLVNAVSAAFSDVTLLANWS